MDKSPNAVQLESLYRVAYQLTYLMFQPIHLICVNDRTHNVYILSGHDEELDQIKLNGEVD